MVNALLNSVNLSREVPGSILYNGELHSFVRASADTGVSHGFLHFHGPPVLVDINTRAGIGAQDRDRSVQVLIVSIRGLIGVFPEVCSHLVRELFILLGAEVINNFFIKSPYGAYRDENDEGEDKEEESAGAVGKGNHALLAVAHKESEKSEEQEEGSDAEEGSLVNVDNFVVDSGYFSFGNSSLSDHVFEPLRSIKAGRNDQHTDSHDHKTKTKHCEDPLHTVPA